MWKHWSFVVSGIVVILVPFIHLSLAIEKLVLILLGIFIVVVGLVLISENNGEDHDDLTAQPTDVADQI